MVRKWSPSVNLQHLRGKHGFPYISSGWLKLRKAPKVCMAILNGDIHLSWQRLYMDYGTQVSVLLFFSKVRVSSLHFMWCAQTLLDEQKF